MTPEVVIFRYLEILNRDPVDAAALTRIICADADLLGRWLSVLTVIADPDVLRQKLTELPASTLRTLARAEAQSLLLSFTTTRLSLERWEAVLRSAFLAEALARESAAALPVADTAQPQPSRVRSLVLLAVSGVTLPHDLRLRELIDFRGAAPDLLLDADSLHQILAVIDAAESGDRGAGIASRLLRIPAERFTLLLSAAEETCQRLLRVTGIQDDSETAWNERIASEERLATLAQLFDGEDLTTTHTAHALASRELFSREPALILRGSDGSLRLEPDRAVRIHAESEVSDIARACREGIAVTLEDHAGIAIADRQVLRRLGADEALVLPMLDSSSPRAEVSGAVVFAIDEESEPDHLMRAYVQMLSRALRRQKSSAPVDPLAGIERYRQKALVRLREIVHEANNPLSIVNNYLHILELRLQDDPTMREQLSTMSRELRRAAGLLQQVKDLPLPEQDAPLRSEPEKTSFDLGALVRRVAELHRGYAATAGVELEATQLPVGRLVTSDEDLLAQVLTNLLRNAIEACRSGDLVTVSIAPEVWRNGQKGAEVEIHDSGPGIEPQVLQHLFEPKASTKGPDHSGIGLPVVYRIVNALAGGVDVRTSPAAGTSFCIFLPDSAAES